MAGEISEKTLGLLRKSTQEDEEKISRKADFLRRPADAGLWRTSRPISPFSYVGQGRKAQGEDKIRKWPQKGAKIAKKLKQTAILEQVFRLLQSMGDPPT